MLARKIIFLDSSQASTKDLATGYARFDYVQPIEPFPGGVKIAVVSFSYTNFFINISAPNNVIYYSNDALDPTKYAITIPTGSYGLTDLNDYCSAAQLAQVGVAQVIFTLEPNFSTGKVNVVFGNVAAWYVNFTANSPSILGFGVQHVPVTDSNTPFYLEESPNAASFNSVTQVKVTSDLATDSIDNSNLSSNVIHISTPNVGIGSVQVDQPNNLITIESSKLTTKVSSITVQLVDQNNQPVAMAEDYSIVLMLV
jgi:hypothetical protein